MSSIYLTSDTHFGHDREFIWGPRGFLNVQQQDETVIENWNAIVEPDDIVYHLGDVMLNDNEHGLECVRRLNGHIKLILGNHDTDARKKLYETLPNVEVLGYSAMIKYKKYNFYLSHFPTLTANLDGSTHLRENILNLYGHTHQKTNFYEDRPFMYHVGLDSHHNTPVLLDDIIQDMKDKLNECLEMVAEKAATDASAPVLASATGGFMSYTQRAVSMNRPDGSPICAGTTDPWETKRCHKCVHTFPLCGYTDANGNCKKYKKNAPDGGFYG